jgi:hypothetical protein
VVGVKVPGVEAPGVEAVRVKVGGLRGLRGKAWGLVVGSIFMRRHAAIVFVSPKDVVMCRRVGVVSTLSLSLHSRALACTWQATLAQTGVGKRPISM